MEACKHVDGWHEILGADWDEEIGALTETTADSFPNPPMLLFDRIKGYPPGFRVVSLLISSYRRFALGLGLPVDRSKLELVRMATRKVMEARPIPPAFVADGPVLENQLTGSRVDMLRFPAPRFHALDGGRYIGTGGVLINQDQESGFVNMGTYRIQVHGPDRLGLWISPGQHGRLICQQYWDQGKSCPVVATFGGDPVTFMAACTKGAWGRSELDFVGGLRGRPLEVIRGAFTGLPIPAHAEIAIEGEVPPPGVEALPEGPFGEWPGYYSAGTLGTGEPQPVIRVKAIYHRHAPIIVNKAPMWTAAPQLGLPMDAGLLWNQLEGAGIQDVVGVYTYYSYMVVVAIRQRYPGHAKQVGLAALASAATARNGRYVVVVDEDIDPTDMNEVLWAMQTRVDPSRDIELIDGCWSTPLDPRMPPEKRQNGDFTNSRAIFYAVRPFHWKEKFPKVSRTDREMRRQVIEKYRSIIPFPPM